MSYVEKAFYKYIKDIFTSGLTTLFSKKYFAYTVSFILMTVSSTVFYYLKNNQDSATLSMISEILLYMELSLAVTYIIFGIFFAKYSLKYWMGPAFVVGAGGTALLYFFEEISGGYELAPYVAAFCYLAWIVVSMFLTFSLSRNFWGNKVLGSIMFLGKKADEGSILFSGVVFLLSLVNGAMSIYLTYKALTDSTLNRLLLGSALFSLLAVIAVNIIVFSLGYKDDVFYTILAFYYVFSSATLWKIVYYTYQGNPPRDNIGSMVVTLFFVLYTVSGYGKKVKGIKENRVGIIEAEMQEYTTNKKEKKQEEEEEESNWFLLGIPKNLGPLGVLMVVMGLVMGYHVTQIQFLSRDDIFSQLFLSSDVLVGIRDKFGVIFISFLMLFFMTSYKWSNEFRIYASPELYRFEFLPPFEELMDKFEKIRTGEESWKSYAKTFLLQGVKIGAKSAAKKTIINPSKKVAGWTKSGFKKLFGKDDNN